jgi:YVTN family beta-propeller protein
MIRTLFVAALLNGTILSGGSAWAGQAPGAASAPDIPVSHRDRVYAAEQFSNTVSVTDPADNKLLGVIRLGEPLPTNFSPLYKGQLLVHGMGFSPDHRTIAVVSIGSNSVTFIDTATNAIKHVTYVGRSPLHDQPGGLGDRQRDWADPSGGSGRGGRAPPLPGHCTGVGDAAGQAGAGAGGVIKPDGLS